MQPDVDAFPFSRRVLGDCSVTAGDQRIAGVPLFDGSFTKGGGLLGKLGEPGERGSIALVEFTPQVADDAENVLYQVRTRAEAKVNDPNTAESLKPYYRQFCKRPCFHDDYLPTFNRDNVHLIDTEGKGVEALTAKGVIANGQEVELGCIIFATGFEVS